MNLKKRENILRDLIADHRLDLTDPDVLEAVEYWAAEDCVEVIRAWGGAPVSVTVTQKGRAYFMKKGDTKREKISDAVRSFFSNYFAGLFSGITATLLLEHVIVPLLSKALR